MDIKLYFSNGEYDYILANTKDINLFIEEIKHCKSSGKFIKVTGKFGHTYYINPDRIRCIVEVLNDK